MEDHNPYRAPDAVVADVAAASEGELASLGERLGGAIIDGLISLAIVLPIMFATGYFQGAMSGNVPGFGTQLLYIAMGFAIFCLVQGYPLAQSGQTWGKRVMKTRIVGLNGAQQPVAALLGSATCQCSWPRRFRSSATCS